MSIPVYEFDASDSRRLGQLHGEALKDSIKEMAQLRLEMMLYQTNFQEAEIHQLAKAHLPILKAYSLDLYDELQGISEGSGVTLEALVVLNHYTDMRDLTRFQVKKILEEPEGDLGCTVVFTPTQKGLVLAQTWDIHASSTPHVCLLRLKNPRPNVHEVVVFSVSGCLGVCGMNSHGVGMGINNLSSLDAHIGLVWPALVRKSLLHEKASLAYEEVLKAPLGSGHHYAVADKTGCLALETSGCLKRPVHQGAFAYVHTNHCLHVDLQKETTIRPGSTTYERYETMNNLLAAKPVFQGVEDVFCHLEQVSLLPNPKEPKKPATCGAIAMDLNHKKILAVKGPVSRDCDPVILEVL